MTVDRNDVPLVPGVIRMEQSISAWARPHPTDPSITLYTELDLLDMKGNVPASLMNMFISSEVGKEFESMYKAIKKPKDTKAFMQLYQTTSGPYALASKFA